MLYGTRSLHIFAKENMIKYLEKYVRRLEMHTTKNV